jgi:lipopolysaccharide exporter
VRKLRFFNVKGDLFALGTTWVANAFIRVGSSLILTRILTPGAYGTMGVLVSIVLILVMLSDTGFAVCIVRSEHGEEPRYLNTAWTVHMLRALVNAALMYFGAPLLARLYHAPILTAPLRVVALWFLIDGIESPAFPVLLRRKRSRVILYSEITGTIISTAFTIVYCYFHRDFWGMVYGYLLNRLIVVGFSHSIKLDFPLRPVIDWAAAKEMFEYTRFVMPSSTLTLFLNQFDKAVFLRLFDLTTLGIYSLAGGIAGQVDTVINRAATAILYPRCAHNFRTERGTFALKYYLENLKLYAATLGLPAALGGSAHFVISLLYDPRYARAAAVLQAFMMRSVLAALASPAENMLIATGESRIILTGNLYRAICIIAGSLLGYRLFGFMGFTYGVALTGLPTLGYYLWLQNKKEYLMPRYELYKVVFVCVVAAAAYVTSSMLVSLWHPSLRSHA